MTEIIAWFAVLLAACAFFSVFWVRYTEKQSITVATIVVVGLGAAAYLLNHYLR